MMEEYTSPQEQLPPIATLGMIVTRSTFDRYHRASLYFNDDDERPYEIVEHPSQTDFDGGALIQGMVRLQVQGSWLLRNVISLDDLHQRADRLRIQDEQVMREVRQAFYRRIAASANQGNLEMVCKKDEVSWRDRSESYCWCCGEPGEPGSLLG